MNRIVNAAACSILAAFILTGCSQKEILPGKREELVLLDGQYEAIPEIDKSKIFIDEETMHPEFPQAFLNSAHYYEPHRFSLNPKNIWTASLDFEANESLKMTASPIVADGKVFCIDAAGIVYAFDQKTGQKIWRTSTLIVKKDGQIGGAISYENGYLIVTSSFSECLALNSKNGKILWRIKLPATCKGDGITVSGGKAFIMCGNSNISAIDISSGKVLWSHTGMIADAAFLGSASACIDDNVVYLAYPSGEIYALLAETGAVIWDAMLSKFSLTNSAYAFTHPRACPVVNGDIVYFVTSSQQTVAFDKKTGKCLWSNDFGSLQTPIVSGNSIFVFSSLSELVCMNKDTGKLRWKKKLETNIDHTTDWYGQILIKDHIVMLSPEGKMLFISVYNGDVKKTIQIGGKISVNPVIANNVMYILMNGGSIAAYK